MERQREEYVEDLEHLVEGFLPSELEKLSDNQLKLLHEVVGQVLEKERAGFDKFFESISQTLKYIPNFIVLAITNKYIEPPIAARITSKLPLKNAVAIAKGLSTSYICETAIFLDERNAAELLERLPRKQSRDILECLYDTYPLHTLDILCHANQNIKSTVEPPFEIFDEGGGALSQHRESILSELKLLF